MRWSGERTHQASSSRRCAPCPPQISPRGDAGKRMALRCPEDANGNLFGTVFQGGAYNLATAFEIANTISGYANPPPTLVDFNGTNGANPAAGLIADGDGSL